MDNGDNIAPGAPGKRTTWTSASKSGVGTAVDSNSNVAFTICDGIITEVYYPRIDNACIRDMQFFVTNETGFFSSEKKDTSHAISWMKEGVPAFKIKNTSAKYCIEKEIICDPLRDVLLQQIIFTPAADHQLPNAKLFVILTPHINNDSAGNTGWKDSYHGAPMLFASRGDVVLALACTVPFLKSSIGYSGTSDGYTDIEQHHQMNWEYEKATDGNIALTAQIDFTKTKKIVFAIGFGSTQDDAASQAHASLLDGFDHAKDRYIYEWQKWQRQLKNIKSNRNTIGKNFRTSAAVLRVHDSKNFPGGIIASLSIPWGHVKTDKNVGGYHLVWPRDLVLSSGGFLELESKDNLLRVLNYLMSTQRSDGCWSQNMWLEGMPYWEGVQMDQVALAVLLVNTAYEANFLDEERKQRYWPIIKKAIIYLLKNGPSTPQDRWEEESGITPFTIAAQVAALLAGAALAENFNEPAVAKYCRETADCWNDNIEHWLYVKDTDVSKELGIEGYYMRINPTGDSANDVKNDLINLKNHEGDSGKIQLGNLVCVDALALVRFGVRAPDDPRILNTIKAIDAKLKVETPGGPCWHRYVNDGYGEDVNGDFSNKTGLGRAWPLLTGERGHYEIAAGNFDKAKELLKAMESFSNNALLPEQIWDTEDIPEKGLFFGRPTGSAMPLTWAHAEYIKLTSSIKNKKVSDLPPLTHHRYIKNTSVSGCDIWRFGNQLKTIASSKQLRIETFEEAIVRWTDNDWETLQDTDTSSANLEIYFADIPTAGKKGKLLIFTFYWKKAKKWENKNFELKIQN